MMDRSDGNIMAVRSSDCDESNILNNTCFTYLADDDPWNDPGTKTAPADIDKGVLANAGSSVLGINEAVCIIVTVQADEILWDVAIRANVPIQDGGPDGGRARS